MSGSGGGDFGLLLAAGASRRWGPGDKLLSDRAGRPLVSWAAAALRAVPLAGRIAVVRSAEVAALLHGFRIVMLPAGGEMSDSLRAGVAEASRAGAGRLLIALGDMPAVSPATLARVLAGCDEAAPSACGHGAAGRPGPPACLPAAMFAEARALRGDRGAGALLAGRARLIDTCPGELEDVDTPPPG